jgi:hypothetical protein
MDATNLLESKVLPDIVERLQSRLFRQWKAAKTEMELIDIKAQADALDMLAGNIKSMARAIIDE